MNIKDIINTLRNPQEQNLKLQSLRAAAWSLLGKGGGNVLRFASSLILTRLLFPEAFGLIATATTVLAMIQLFSDTGVKTALVQNPRGGEPAFLNTAWLISMARSVLLFAIVAALCAPLASFYDQSELAPLLLFMSTTIVFDGLLNPALQLTIKEMRTERYVAYELCTQLLGFIVTVTLAWITQSVWALAWGAVSAALFRVTGSYMVHTYRPKFQWDRLAGRELFHFGKFIFLNTMITWAALNLDRLVIGKLLDMETLGYYNIGLNIGLIVEMVLVQIFSQSYFPAVSKVADDRQRVVRIYRRTAALVVAVAVPVLVVEGLFASALTGILYDPRYALASIALMWICFRGVFRVLSLAQSGTFLALGKPGSVTAAMGIGLLITAIALPLGVQYAGLAGASVAVFGAGVAIAAAESILLIKQANFPTMKVVRPWIQLLGCAAGIVGVYKLLAPFYPTEGWAAVPFILLMGFIALIISGAVYIMLEGKRPFSDDVGASRGVL